MLIIMGCGLCEILLSGLAPVEEIAMSGPTSKWMLGHHTVIFQSNFLLSGPRQCDLCRTVPFCGGFQASLSLLLTPDFPDEWSGHGKQGLSVNPGIGI